MAQYGNVQTVKNRTGADGDTFGITDAELDDEIESLLEQASDEVERYCSRSFDKHEGEESIVQGSGRRTLRIPKYPVLAIDSVESSGGEVDADAYRIKGGSGMLGDENAGILEWVSRFRKWRSNVDYTITYDWGYEEPPGVVVSVVEEMVIDTVNEWEAEIRASGTQSVSMDGYSVTYDVADATQKGAVRQSQKDRLDQLKAVGAMVA